MGNIVSYVTSFWPSANAVDENDPKRNCITVVADEQKSLLRLVPFEDHEIEQLERESLFRQLVNDVPRRAQEPTNDYLMRLSECFVRSVFGDDFATAALHTLVIPNTVDSESDVKVIIPLTVFFAIEKQLSTWRDTSAIQIPGDHLGIAATSVAKRIARVRNMMKINSDSAPMVLFNEKQDEALVFRGDVIKTRLVFDANRNVVTVAMKNESLGDSIEFVDCFSCLAH